MKRVILLSVIITLSFLQSGCIGLIEAIENDILYASTNTSEQCWLYKPNTYKAPVQILDKTAVVRPFRVGELVPGSPLSGKDTLIGFIPGVLYVTGEYYLDFIPQTDFAIALALELQSANIFRKVRFEDADDNSDYIFSGTVLEAKKKERKFWYGVSFLAMPLWFILPIGSFPNDLSVEITCTDAKTGNLVFSKVYTSSNYSNIFWIYYQPRKCNFGDMTQVIYKQFVEDLRVKLTEGLVTNPAEQSKP